ncbi:MAG: polyprenyl synthetase family protein [Clostridiales bacterium]|nr:polyprenyl synthetase family protein [Clostridiales bacterium]
MFNEDYLRYKELVERHLTDFLPEIDQQSATLYDAMKYSLTSGGKRIRPVLLLAACEFCGCDINQALPYAAAVEYIHTYSLIHDDLPAMDDDEMRRGKPTNHMVFGEDMAILAGDGLLSSAFEAMMKDMLLYFDNPDRLKCRVRAAYEIAKGAGCKGMVAGQVADIESQGKHCAREYIEYIHLNKTAALIVSSVKAGAYLACGEQDRLKALASYGEAIGLGFQIADDLLDIYGDSAAMGKSTGKDDAHKKCTFPAIYGAEESRQRLTDLTNKAIELMEPFYDEGEFFVTIAKRLAERNK